MEAFCWFTTSENKNKTPDFRPPVRPIEQMAKKIAFFCINASSSPTYSFEAFSKGKRRIKHKAAKTQSITNSCFSFETLCLRFLIYSFASDLRIHRQAATNNLLRCNNYFLLLGMTDVHNKEIRSYNMSRIMVS